MNPRRFRTRVSLILTASILATALAAPPAAASCLRLQDFYDPSDEHRVFVGTVVSVDGTTTVLKVEGWYQGEGPAVVTVTGGRSEEVVTSADWMPLPGERYAVIATADIVGTLLTEPCGQQLVDDELSAWLVETFGEPMTVPSFQPDDPSLGELSPSALPIASPLAG